MKALTDFGTHDIQVLFTDIDDTLTDHGKLEAAPYKALWDLKSAGIRVVPVTGRPAGWCEMIARLWPVDGVVGENGGFYFRYDHATSKMNRHFNTTEVEREKNRVKLEQIATEVLREVPGCALASDQFSRMLDLAIDFSEDVMPLNETAVQKIVKIFNRHGAVAKISSIHVNGWFGNYDKLSMCQVFTKEELGRDLVAQNQQFAFVGDSPNDEPMFAAFANSFAVANIKNFLPQLKHHPSFVAPLEGGHGFVAIAEALIKNRRAHKTLGS
jgi:HAD superfamily hydrolase (TIGR01484 family)